MELPTTTRQVHLASRPDGRLTTEQFRVVDVPLEAPADGHVVVRAEHLSLAAVMRELMDADADLPMPRFEVDQALTTYAIGTVVASARDDVPAGSLVALEMPWAEYADATDVVPLPRDVLPSPEYHLATGNGATALQGVRDIAGVGPDDVVLVTGAAGGVGSMAGQIARRLGARRVIGTAGSSAKCDWLTGELGLDAAVDYHDDPLVDSLRRAAPDGVDVVIDLVGGTQFEAAVQVANAHARIAVGGALATQQAGAPWPRFDTQTAIVKDLTVHGFALAYALELMGEWPGLFGQWLAEGFVYPHTVVEGGLEDAPQTLIDLLAGAYTGTVSLRLPT